MKHAFKVVVALRCRLSLEGRTDVPIDAMVANGNRGQLLIVVPSRDLVIVRRGLDWLPNRARLSALDLTREVLKAFGDGG